MESFLLLGQVLRRLTRADANGQVLRAPAQEAQAK